MPKSMTAFARCSTNTPWGQANVEIRTVNHRYLEMSFRLPETFRHLEMAFRKTISDTIKRGKVDCQLTWQPAAESESSLSINAGLANALLACHEQLTQQTDAIGPLDSLRLLQWPGLLQKAPTENPETEKAIQQLLAEALDTLTATRQREGEALAQFITEKLDNLGQLQRELTTQLPVLQQQYRQRLHDKLAQLVEELEPQRFEQEIVYALQKFDVAEELERLETHENAAREALTQQTPMGRRLDFLMQELNREANTLSSKALSTDVTNTAVAMKVCIEQMREQIQNIE